MVGIRKRSWSGRWTQTKYAKLQLWRTFNLNKTQSLNGALRAVYMEEEGGNFVALVIEAGCPDLSMR